MTRRPVQPDPDPATAALPLARRTEALLAEATATIGHLANALETGLQTPFNDVSVPRDLRAEHLRAHRPGHPGKIESDPGLEAFILARIDTTTFPALAAQIAAAFPPERRVSTSSIHRWWHRTKPRQPPTIG